MHPAPKAAWTLATVLAVVSIALVAATARLLLWPKTDSPAGADAVAVLAGGQGERLAKALELIHAGRAPTLVIANGGDPKWPEANRLCSGASSLEVVCFRPTLTTRVARRGRLARSPSAVAGSRSWS
jgi:hypothetical protein